MLRGVAATVIFFYILPAGDRCPNCDAVTLRVESRFCNVILPWFRTSWCFECGWHGMLRQRPSQSGTDDRGAHEAFVTPPPGAAAASTVSHSGQLPLSSK